MNPQPHTAHTAQTRAEINKQNAQHSTGPRTSAGKQRVSTNATTHGLTAKTVMLADGESERYEKLLVQLSGKWRPETGEEHDLVLALRDAQWRLRSIPVTQINLTTLVTEEHMEAYEHLENPAAQRCAAQAAAYRANAKLFEQLSRHEGRLERSIRDMEKRLTALIGEREEEAPLSRHNEAGKESSAHAASRENSTEQTHPPADFTTKQTQPAAPATTRPTESASANRNPSNQGPRS